MSYYPETGEIESQVSQSVFSISYRGKRDIAKVTGVKLELHDGGKVAEAGSAVKLKINVTRYFGASSMLAVVSAMVSSYPASYIMIPAPPTQKSELLATIPLPAGQYGVCRVKIVLITLSGEVLDTLELVFMVV